MNKIQELAKMIDHTILHPTLGTKSLIDTCNEAIKYETASVCVKPYMVPEASTLLKDTEIKVGCVIGFPSGNASIASKVFETIDACKNGATEIDMVINIAKALEHDWQYITKEIDAVTKACHEHGAIVKVIIETDYVSSDTDIIKLCQICTDVKADYIKTSTGFGFVKGDDGTLSSKGATPHHLKLMKQNVGPNVKVKASGGIRTLDALLEVQKIGCERCGTTSTIQILEEAKKRYGN